MPATSSDEYVTVTTVLHKVREKSIFDAPELVDLQELEREGLVESRLVDVGEQGSALKFRWKR